MTTADFVAIVTGQREYHPGEFAGDRVSLAAGHYREEWPNTGPFGGLESSDPFAAGGLREYNYNPDEPRDEKGRWTTGGSGSVWTKVLPTGDPGAPDKPPPGAAGKSEPSKGGDGYPDPKNVGGFLAPDTSADASATEADKDSAIFGMREFKTADQKHTMKAQFAGFDNEGRILLRPFERDGKKVAADAQGLVTADPNKFDDAGKKFLAEMAKLGQDEAFKAGLKAKPDNIHLDSRHAPGDKMTWEADVIRGIGMLSELPTGQQILDDAKTKGAEGKQVTISPSEGDNFARGGDVHFNADRTTGARTETGDRERPPFLGLGQELSNAVSMLSPGYKSTADRETAGLEAGRQLRSEYNATFDNPGRANDLSNKYPGWGKHKVDEKVLGLDGRPVRAPRNRDR
jgi:hypothetical protein